MHETLPRGYLVAAQNPDEASTTSYPTIYVEELTGSQVDHGDERMEQPVERCRVAELHWLPIQVVIA